MTITRWDSQKDGRKWEFRKMAGFTVTPDGEGEEREREKGMPSVSKALDRVCRRKSDSRMALSGS